MGRPFIVLGDRTDHGGTVVEASVMSDTHGKGIARVGDKVTCPRLGHGTTVIVTGDPTMIIDGQPAARHGDKCACGAVLISSQVVSSTGSSGAPSKNHDVSAAQAAAALAKGYAADTGALFDDRLILIDEATGNPLAHLEYGIRRATGDMEFGVTDDLGQTHLLSATSQEEQVEIYA